MTEILDRTLLSHLVIIIALCGGSWYMLVHPNAKQIAELEHAVLQHLDDIIVDERMIERMADLAASRLNRISVVDEYNQLAGDASRLYGIVSHLAHKHEIVLSRLEPARRKRDLDNNSGAASIVDISASGSYRALALFVRELELIDGFVRIGSLAASPSHEVDHETINMRINLEVLRFVLPDLDSEQNWEVAHAGS